MERGDGGVRLRPDSAWVGCLSSRWFDMEISCACSFASPIDGSGRLTAPNGGEGWNVFGPGRHLAGGIVASPAAAHIDPLAW